MKVGQRPRPNRQNSQPKKHLHILPIKSGKNTSLNHFWKKNRVGLISQSQNPNCVILNVLFLFWERLVGSTKQGMTPMRADTPNSCPKFKRKFAFCFGVLNRTSDVTFVSASTVEHCNIETQHDVVPFLSRKSNWQMLFVRALYPLIGEAEQLNVGSLTFIPRPNRAQTNKTIGALFVLPTKHKQRLTPPNPRLNGSGSWQPRMTYVSEFQDYSRLLSLWFVPRSF